MANQANILEARRLAALPETCIKNVERELTILVHPMYCSDLKKGVHEELKALSRGYNKVLGGITMAYEHVQLVSSHGWLFDTNPFNHIIVRAQFYIFSPEVGSILEGVVKKKSVNHIGCLVHGMFNVSIPRPVNTFGDSWCGTHVQEGDDVKLTVTYVSLTNFMPYIKAELDPEQVQELVNSRSQKDEQENNMTTENSPKENVHVVFNDDSGISSNEFEESFVNSKNKAIKQNSISETSEDDKKVEVKKLQKVKGTKRKMLDEDFCESHGEELYEVKHIKMKRKQNDSERGNMDLIVGDIKESSPKKRKKHNKDESHLSSALKLNDNSLTESENNKSTFPSDSIKEKYSIDKSKDTEKTGKKLELLRNINEDEVTKSSPTEPKNSSIISHKKKRKFQSQKLEETNDSPSGEKSFYLTEAEIDIFTGLPVSFPSSTDEVDFRSTTPQQKRKRKSLSEELKEISTITPKSSTKLSSKRSMMDEGDALDELPLPDFDFDDEQFSGKSQKRKAEVSPNGKKSGKKRRRE